MAIGSVASDKNEMDAHRKSDVHSVTVWNIPRAFLCGLSFFSFFSFSVALTGLIFSLRFSARFLCASHFPLSFSLLSAWLRWPHIDTAQTQIDRWTQIDTWRDRSKDRYRETHGEIGGAVVHVVFRHAVVGLSGYLTVLVPVVLLSSSL